MMREMSSRSSMRWASEVVLRSIVSSARSRRSSSKLPRRSHQIQPMSAFSGVRSSCESVARKDRKSTRLNSSHLVISYAVLFFQKNTRLNSSHLVISYAVFCLKKKMVNHYIHPHNGNLAGGTADGQRLACALALDAAGRRRAY